ncbi:DNA translocase FtsK [Candidatus Gracilibacteria bacterium]|nr:DNA translocase FtsK [Candidatus Gracilibacteria bacterium]
MARRTTKRRTKKSTSSFLGSDFYHICIGTLLIILAVLVFFSTQEVTTTGNAPLIGKYLSKAGTLLFGKEYYRWIFSPIVGILGVMIIAKKAYWSGWRFVGLILFFLSATSLLGWYSGEKIGLFNIYSELEKFIGKSSAFIFLFGLFFISIYLILRIAYWRALGKIKDITPSLKDIGGAIIPPEPKQLQIPKKAPKKEEKGETITSAMQRKLDKIQEQIDKTALAKAPQEKTSKIPKLFTKKEKSSELPEKKIPVFDMMGNILTKKKEVKEETKENTGSTLPDFGTWNFPSTSLLEKIQKKNVISKAEIEAKSLLIQKTFLEFGIDVDMEDECVGPTVIQYRLKPAQGVKISKIESLKKDLTLALKAKSIRIEAPIPGLGLVGIEVPNDHRDMVGIREVLEHKAFTSHKSKLAVALGKDISGNFVVGNLEKMPHLLIAGQTGSGKSVGVNGILVSLLYKNTPSDLRFIMVDPKQVELGMYNGIPHLLTPVITSPEKALNALKWAVAEMERRYNMLTKIHTKNLAEYNRKVEKKDKLPAIVFVIDELADLMMSGDKKSVETCISRIAQKARAVGIHLILATQRPSVDVITGLIKANVPSRIAFTVSSQIDSRTILDGIGAEDLLGMGDMLYSPTGSMSPTRVQGMFVDTDEIESVVNHIKRTIDPEMLKEIQDESIANGGEDRGNFEGSAGGLGKFNEDPKIVEEAILLVKEQGKCSTSMLQRHLNLGYGRAARVVDILEEMEIVGPANGSKPREVIG